MSAAPDPVPTTPEDLLAAVASRYDAEARHVDAGGEPFEILVVRDTNSLLDRISPEAFAGDERLPYWADLWTSSLDLATWLLEGEPLGGKNVLELGCGVGLAGIAAARAGAQVTMTDYEADALLFARYNAMINLSADTFRHRVWCTLMDWRQPDIGGTFDLIIGADVVYERRNFAPVLSLLQSHLSPGGRALLTEPDRTVGQAFLAEAQRSPLVVEHSLSEVTREGKSFRISRMLLRHEPIEAV